MAVNNVGSATVPPPTNQNTSAQASQAKRSEKAQATSKTGLDAYNKANNAQPSAKDAANVQISQKGRELALARKVVDETPDVREDKVAKFKDLIAKGEYKPDAAKITTGIVKEAVRDELAKTPEVALE